MLRYNENKPDINQLQSDCIDCKNTEKKKFTLADEERILIESLRDGNKEFFILNIWWNQWIGYIRKQGPPPGKINNSQALDKHSKIRVDAKFKDVTASMWWTFYLLYDCDVEIVAENEQKVARLPSVSQLDAELIEIIEKLKESKELYYPNTA